MSGIGLGLGNPAVEQDRCEAALETGLPFLLTPLGGYHYRSMGMNRSL
jgi:hypothetical protein